jgi:hypothetical protein
MQKVTRAATHKPARHIVKPARRPRGSAPKLELQPTITRIDRSVDLVAPRGCSASVLLKLVTRDDGHRYYVWWAVAGRHDADAFSVHYKHNGEDVLRVDLPDGMPLSAASLQPHLESYLKSENTQPSDPPVIRG